MLEKAIRIMAGAWRRESYINLFEKFHILNVASKNLLALITFIIENLETFQVNSEVHAVSTRYKHDFHRPVANQSIKMESYYAGTKLYNKLPLKIIC
jgi:hypothetical protein